MIVRAKLRKRIVLYVRKAEIRDNRLNHLKMKVGLYFGD